MDSQNNKPHKYAVIISWSADPGDQVFVAGVPELPACTAHVETHEEALAVIMSLRDRTSVNE
jgi:predicted RNase H-like HicB family nuclease